MVSAEIGPDQVRHIAHLARLNLTDEQCAAFGVQLAAVLDYMSKLNEVNTDGVEPTAHALAVQNVLRDDTPTEPMGTGRALENAPDADPPYFKLPKVLDGE